LYAINLPNQKINIIGFIKLISFGKSLSNEQWRAGFLWKKYLEPVHRSTRRDGDNDDCGEAEELESDNCYFLREELAMSENDHHCGTLATGGVPDPGVNYQQRLLFNVEMNQIQQSIS